MRHLATIVEIASCDPHPNADRLSIATMKQNGWKVITARDEFKPGDLACFFEIDAYLPADDERYAFLRDRSLRKFVSKSGKVLREGIRIKTCKLRGEISQGLLMPLDKFPEVTDQIVHYSTGDKMLVHDNGSYLTPTDLIGADVSSLLHVEHYDEISEQMKPLTGASLAGDIMGSFPDKYAPRSDETRIQNLSEYFTTMKGRRFEITAKFDGTSTSIAYSPNIDNENPFIVCSRNNRLKEFSANGVMPLYWLMARKYDIERKLKKHYDTTGDEWMLQLETVGCGVNGNADRYTDNQMFCFRIWDIGRQQFVSPTVRRKFCLDNQIPHVTVIAESMPFFDVVQTMDAALKFAEGKTERGNEREGVVLKSCDNGPFVSFKIVSNRYLLGQKD